MRTDQLTYLLKMLSIGIIVLVFVFPLFGAVPLPIAMVDKMIDDPMMIQDFTNLESREWIKSAQPAPNHSLASLVQNLNAARLVESSA